MNLLDVITPQFLPIGQCVLKHLKVGDVISLHRAIEKSKYSGKFTLLDDCLYIFNKFIKGKISQYSELLWLEIIEKCVHETPNQKRCENSKRLASIFLRETDKYGFEFFLGFPYEVLIRNYEEGLPLISTFCDSISKNKLDFFRFIISKRGKSRLVIDVNYYDLFLNTVCQLQDQKEQLEENIFDDKKNCKSFMKSLILTHLNKEDTIFLNRELLL